MNAETDISNKDLFPSGIDWKCSLDLSSSQWDVFNVHRMLAMLLLVCFGILVPAAAMPLRVCLLENLVLVAEIATDGTCCDDCERKDGNYGDCCVDLDALPESAIPDSSTNAPPLIVIDLPPHAVALLAPRASDPTMIRMADIAESDTWPPSARRALLGVWRL